MKTFTKRKFLYCFALIISVFAAAFLLTACSGNEYDGSGAAEIRLTLKGTYDGAEVSCPDGDITQSGSVFTIKVGSRKMTDVIITCEGYFTETVNVKTSDYVNGVAEKEIELRKRVNVLTLTVSGVPDVNNISVESKNDLIKSKTVNGKKIVLEFKEFAKDDRSEVDVLEVSCSGYYTNSLGIERDYFIDYSASLSVNLLSASSKYASVTFVNDVDGSQYRFNIYNAVGQTDKVAASVNVKTSVTKNLDKSGSYYVSVSDQRQNFLSPIVFKPDSPYLAVPLSSIRGIANAKEYRGDDLSSKDEIQVSFDYEIRQLANMGGVKLFTENGGDINFDYDRECIYAKNGDKIKVLITDENGRLYSCYTAAVENKSFTLEKKIDDGLTAKIRFVDPYGNALTAAQAAAKDCEVKLFNSYAGSRYLVDDEDEGGENGLEFIDIADSRLSETIAVCGENEITVDITKYSALSTLDGENYNDKNGSGIYVSLQGIKYPEKIEFSELLRSEYYEVVAAEELDFNIYFVKYNSDPNAAKQYITDIDTEGRNLEKEEGYDYYKYKAHEAQLVRFDNLGVTDPGGVNDFEYIRSYSDAGFLAFKDYYIKDPSDANAYRVEIPLYERREVQITFSGDLSSIDESSGNMSFTIGGDRIYVKKDNYENVVYARICENHIGTEFTFEYENYGGSSRENYIGDGTITRENFDTKTMEIKLTRYRYDY